MARLHYDRATGHEEIAARRRQMLEAALAEARTDRDRAALHAQDALFDVQLAAVDILIGLIETGRDAAFIGTVIGVHAGAVLKALLKASEDPDALVAAHERSVAAVLADDGAGRIVTIVARRGGGTA